MTEDNDVVQLAVSANGLALKEAGHSWKRLSGRGVLNVVWLCYAVLVRNHLKSGCGHESPGILMSIKGSPATVIVNA